MLHFWFRWTGKTGRRRFRISSAYFPVEWIAVLQKYQGTSGTWHAIRHSELPFFLFIRSQGSFVFKKPSSLSQLPFSSKKKEVNDDSEREQNPFMEKAFPKNFLAFSNYHFSSRVWLLWRLFFLCGLFLMRSRRERGLAFSKSRSHLLAHLSLPLSGETPRGKYPLPFPGVANSFMGERSRVRPWSDFFFKKGLCQTVFIFTTSNFATLMIRKKAISTWPFRPQNGLLAFKKFEIRCLKN